MRFQVLTLLAVVAALAVPAQASSTNREACVEVINARTQLRPPSGLGVLWTLFRLKFFPGSLVQVRTTEVAIAPEQRVAPVVAPVQANVIFSIEPPSEIANSPEVETMRRRYAVVSRLISSGLNDFKKIAGAKTVADCLTRAEKAGFDFNAFMKLAQERNSLGLVEQIDEGRLTNKVIQGTLSHLKLDWRVVHSTDLMEVHEALREPGLRNVVIVAHGLSGGKLVDSRLNEYPLGFFSEIAPGIRSLSIFACHGEEIAKLYDVARQLGGFRSQFTRRTLYVSKGTRLGSLEEMVPVRAFPSFMTKVDQRLASRGPLEPRVDKPGTPVLRCAMSFPGLTVKSGTLGFILNGRYLGSRNQGSTDIELDYPCAFADRKRNILVIRNLSLLAAATIATTAFDVLPDHPGQNLTDTQLKHFYRADGSYQSSKFDFSIP